MNDCQLRFEDTSLSRYHCTLIYDNYWFISDGDGEKHSTNGTWLFAENFFEVFDGMAFKVGETLFKVTLTSDIANINT
jgi:pSer/pThr/pTyr-binding forkhead associated (FHA) protein